MNPSVLMSGNGINTQPKVQPNFQTPFGTSSFYVLSLIPVLGFYIIICIIICQKQILNGVANGTIKG